MRNTLIYLNLNLFLLSFSFNAFSITNNEIYKICQKEVNKISCVKRLKINRYKLEKGIPIEIPVIPYKK